MSADGCKLPEVGPLRAHEACVTSPIDVNVCVNARPSLYISFVTDCSGWIRPMTAGTGSSTPVTLRRTRGWDDGWMDIMNPRESVAALFRTCMSVTVKYLLNHYCIQGFQIIINSAPSFFLFFSKISRKQYRVCSELIILRKINHQTGLLCPSCRRFGFWSVLDVGCEILAAVLQGDAASFLTCLCKLQFFFSLLAVSKHLIC